VSNVLQGPSDIDSTLIMEPKKVVDRLEYVMESVRATKATLRQRGFHVPLLGFSGAPWTLFAYMTGDSIRENGNGERWAREFPEETRKILRVLSDSVIEYLDRQICNGADAVQVFESLGGTISAQTMLQFALPEMARISLALKERHPDVPCMAFARGAGYINPTLQRAKFDVITLDKNIDVGEALGALEETAWVTGRRATVQGNLDPQLLLANSTREAITGAVESMIARVGKQATIANLGGGLMGKEDPDLVAHYVEEVRRLSRRRAE